MRVLIDRPIGRAVNDTLTLIGLLVVIKVVDTVSNISLCVGTKGTDERIVHAG